MLIENLSPYVRNLISDVIYVESNRREKSKMPALRWLEQVLNCPFLLQRLKCFDTPLPIIDDLPSFNDALVYALVTETLGSANFLNYISAREYRYWNTQEEWEDIQKQTHKIWSFPEEIWLKLGPIWYEHVLENGPDYQSSVPKPKSLIECMTNYETHIVTSLGLLSGVLLTGPRHTSFVIVENKLPEQQGIIEAHLLSHLLLAHVNRNRFEIREEYQPGYTPFCLTQDANYGHAEREADNAAVCLLVPEIRSFPVIPVQHHTIRPALKQTLPKQLTKILIHFRQQIYITLNSWLPSAQLKPGSLIRGKDRYVYLVGNDKKKHWICSELVLKAYSGKEDIQSTYKVYSVSEERLHGMAEGSPIYTTQQAEMHGLVYKEKRNLSLLVAITILSLQILLW